MAQKIGSWMEPNCRKAISDKLGKKKLKQFDDACIRMMKGRNFMADVMSNMLHKFCPPIQKIHNIDMSHLTEPEVKKLTELIVKSMNKALEGFGDGKRVIDGILIVYIPVGNISSDKIQGYTTKIIKPLKKVFDRVKKSRYDVIIFPSRTLKDYKVEICKL